jgi:hypothetical protein
MICGNKANEGNSVRRLHVVCPLGCRRAGEVAGWPTPRKSHQAQMCIVVRTARCGHPGPTLSPLDVPLPASAPSGRSLSPSDRSPNRLLLAADLHLAAGARRGLALTPTIVVTLSGPRCSSDAFRCVAVLPARRVPSSRGLGNGLAAPARVLLAVVDGRSPSSVRTGRDGARR